MSILPDIENYVGQDLQLALKVTIAANLIDFSAKDKIHKQDIKNSLFNAVHLTLAKDNSQDLFCH